LLRGVVGVGVGVSGCHHYYGSGGGSGLFFVNKWLLWLL
jgi:hypothetical protein